MVQQQLNEKLEKLNMIINLLDFYYQIKSIDAFKPEASKEMETYLFTQKEFLETEIAELEEKFITPFLL